MLSRKIPQNESSPTNMQQVSGLVRVAQAGRLTCLSVFELSIRAQTLTMWPLTPCTAWGTCQQSEVISVSWTHISERGLMLHHTLNLSRSFSRCAFHCCWEYGNAFSSVLTLQTFQGSYFFFSHYFLPFSIWLQYYFSSISSSTTELYLCHYEETQTCFWTWQDYSWYQMNRSSPTRGAEEFSFPAAYFHPTRPHPCHMAELMVSIFNIQWSFSLVERFFFT